MSFQLPELHYSRDALAPHISVETIGYHYGKHHLAYATNLNRLIKRTPWEAMSLEEIITGADGAIYNNAAQVWNHSFYWNGLSPQGGGEPHGELGEMIVRDFGSYEKFKEAFTMTAATHFGSGWVWLVMDGDRKLSIMATQNAGCPLREDRTPILTCDVWEHAYYIDYRNDRPQYIEAFWNVANWDFAETNTK